MNYKLNINLKFNKKETWLKVKFNLINHFLSPKNLVVHSDGANYVLAIVYVIMIVVHANAANVVHVVHVVTVNG